MWDLRQKRQAESTLLRRLRFAGGGWVCCWGAGWEGGAAEGCGGGGEWVAPEGPVEAEAEAEAAAAGGAHDERAARGPPEAEDEGVSVVGCCGGLGAMRGSVGRSGGCGGGCGCEGPAGVGVGVGMAVRGYRLAMAGSDGCTLWAGASAEWRRTRRRIQPADATVSAVVRAEA